jgi:hypothetical protein
VDPWPHPVKATGAYVVGEQGRAEASFLREQPVIPNNPKGLFILSGGFSNGRVFSASTGKLWSTGVDPICLLAYSNDFNIFFREKRETASNT